MKDALGAVQSVLVLGGGSEIGLATTKALVAERARTVLLAARKPERLQQAAADLRSAGAIDVELIEFDADDLATHGAFVDDVFSRREDIDLVLVAFGVLGDQEVAERDAEAALGVLHTNFNAAVSVLIPIAARLRTQGHGTVVVLSSVAGERVRRSNFVYGASKAAIDGFAQGLGDALVGSGVHVLVVRPGFVHTRMTTGLEAPPFSTTADEVATAIVKGLRRDAEVIWVPPVLRWVMAVLRHVPRPLFRRLPL